MKLRMAMFNPIVQSSKKLQLILAKFATIKNWEECESEKCWDLDGELTDILGELSDQYHDLDNYCLFLENDEDDDEEEE